MRLALARPGFFAALRMTQRKESSTENERPPPCHSERVWMTELPPAGALSAAEGEESRIFLDAGSRAPNHDAIATVASNSFSVILIAAHESL
jgi:hypothetical protein